MINTIVTKIKSTGDLNIDIQGILKPLGGLDNYIKAGESVLLKPNFNTADPFPASSAIDFLEAVITLVKIAKPSRIILGDSCTMTSKTSEVMEKLGVFEMGKRLGIEIIDFDKGKYIRKKINGKFLKSVKIPAILGEVDRLILLPCLKTHRYARFTISLKLSVGFMKKIDRIFLHARHFEEKVTEINLAYQPDLIVLDGRKSFITYGPETGELVEPNILMASNDRIAIDVEGLKILKNYPAENMLGGDIWQLPQIKRAVELGLGASSEKEYQLINV